MSFVVKTDQTFMDSTPTLYVLTNDSFIQNVDSDTVCPVIKIGTTCYPSHRKSQYVTASPSPPRYLYLFYLNCDKKLLYSLDGILFLNYLSTKNLLHLHVNKGSGCEWYYDIEDFTSILSDYLSSMNINFTLEIGDKYPLFPPQHEYNKLVLQEIENVHIRNFSKQQFLNVMNLPSFRSIQEEFWNKFSISSVPFKGYIKLPTGVGKTIIMIMSLVIAKIIHGNRINAMIVCPQTNIFETVYCMFEKFARGYDIPVFKHYGNHKLTSNLETNKDWVVLLTHQGALKNPLNIFDKCNFIIYDEVHHITGDKFFEMLEEKSSDKQYILGTSATPLTSLKGQKQRFETIFGNTCFLQSSYKRAIDEKWIVKPRLDITVVSGSNDEDFKVCEILADKITNAIKERETKNMDKGRKCICYIPEGIEESTLCLRKVIEIIDNKNIKLYDGNNDDEGREFLEVIDSNWHIMFVCQKYREGSDIKGLEMNFVLGNTNSAHTLLQTIGRTLRNDYEGKEGWCHIIRKGKVGERAWDILFKIYEELTKDFDLDQSQTFDCDIPETNERSKIIDDFIGTITIDNEIFDKEQAIEQLERLYGEKYYGDREITYGEMKKYNKSKNIRSKEEYEQLVGGWPERYRIEHPADKFKMQWKSWYGFLGVDTSKYPLTLKDWEDKIRELGLFGRKRAYDIYVQQNDDLPKDPRQMYEGYKFYPR